MDSEGKETPISSASTVCDSEDSKRETQQELCDTCLGLEISVDKFVIGDKSIEPVFRARNPKNILRDAQRSALFTAKSKNAAICVGTLAEVEARSSRCPVCWLLLSSVQPNLRHLKDVKAFLNWEIDGRGLDSGRPDRRRTRRLHVRWSREDLQSQETPNDAYLVYVARDPAARRDIDFDQSWSKASSFLGRTLDPTSDHVGLVKSWLDDCLTNHQNESCRSKVGDRFHEMVGQSFFGVIDVIDMYLTKLPQDKVSSQDTIGKEFAAYLALSYVWGKETGTSDRQKYITTRKNILMRCRKNGLEKDFCMFPSVIQDAIELTRRLGRRYIWIDSLCIVQDSHRSWQLNADYMDTIYGHSLLTICAADGDSTVKLRAMHQSEERAEPQMRNCAGVRLLVSHAAETWIKSSEWNTRAWTLQERLLSRRTIIFVNGHVYFQCNAATRAENIIAESGSTGWSLDLVQSLPRVLGKQLSRPFWVYMTCMRLYSARVLTKEQDVIAAFKGFENMFTKAMNAPFVFGLPSAHFDIAILWQATHSVERRGGEFPSWSWCGWTCNGKAALEYNDEMLRGALTNIRQWLLDHTWIHWYVRDGHGRLRALWPPADVSNPISEHPSSSGDDSRWRGYMHSGTKPRRPNRESGPERLVRKLFLRDEEGSHRSRRPRSRRGHDRPPSIRLLNIYNEHNDTQQQQQQPQSCPRLFTENEIHQHPEQFSTNIQDARGRTVPTYFMPPPGRNFTTTNAIPNLNINVSNPNEQRNAVTDGYAGMSPFATYNRSGQAAWPPYPYQSPPPPPPWPGQQPPVRRGRRSPNQFVQVRRRSRSRSRSESVIERVETQSTTTITQDQEDLDNRTVRERQNRNRNSSDCNSSTDDPLRYMDIYGRQRQPNVVKSIKTASEFKKTTVDSPHRVVMATTSNRSSINRDASNDSGEGSGSGSNDDRGAPRRSPGQHFRKATYTRREYPDQPFLQFWTWSATLRLVSPISTESSDASLLHRYDITDDIGDWCGFVLLDQAWVASKQARWGKAAFEGSRHEFLALSEAKEFTEQECKTWNYYVPREREHSEWDLYYVMLVEEDQDTNVSSRVAIGKCFKDAFDCAVPGKQWKEIILG